MKSVINIIATGCCAIFIIGIVARMMTVHTVYFMNKQVALHKGDVVYHGLDSTGRARVIHIKDFKDLIANSKLNNARVYYMDHNTPYWRVDVKSNDNWFYFRTYDIHDQMDILVEISKDY